MKKLTAFLEEEREKFNLQFCEDYDWWITDEDLQSLLDTEINKIKEL